MPYQQPPGPRLAYDINGTVGVVRGSDGVVKDILPESLRYLNNERNSMASLDGGQMAFNNQTQDQWVGLIFPVPTRIYGAFILMATYSLGSARQTLDAHLYGSPDTTNGDDGVWTKLGVLPKKSTNSNTSTFSSINMLTGAISSLPSRFVINDVYRRPINEEGYSTFSGSTTRHIRGVKIKWESSLGFSEEMLNYVIHLYGEPDTDSTQNILIFFDPSEERYAPGDMLDWGDVPMGSSADKTFRLLNNSAAQTANNVVIGAQMGISTTSPVPSDSFVFSVDGFTWTPTVTVTAISPGATTGQIRVRRVTPLNAQPSNWAPRVVATVGSWV